MTRAESLLAAEKQVLEMIANRASLHEVLDHLCLTIDAHVSGVISTVLLMDPDGKRLWPGAGPRFPAAVIPAISPWPVGPDSGACGTAAFLKERVIISDVTTDTRWPDDYRSLAVNNGLRAAWSEPLISKDRMVLGTFAMYYAEPRKPDSAHLELIEAAGRIALIAIQLETSQATLRESEERFRLIADTSPVVIYIMDVDKRCTYVNRRGLDFTGRSLDAELGNGWAERLHPEDAAPYWDTLTGAFDRREPFQMECRVQRRDGEYRWIFNQAVPRFNVDGSFTGCIGSWIDITDRKLAEEVLSTVSQRLIEAQEQERARLARELHDDIGQQVALLAIDLDRLKEGLPVAAAELKENLEDTLERMADLGKDVQALSHRLHSSKLELLGLAAAAGGLCGELSDRQGVNIDFRADDVPLALPEEISLCLFRVLQEALQNVVKHSGSQHAHVSFQRGGNEIELTVSDSGIGFDLEGAIKGHGLGLTSMKERLKLVDGRLSIESKPGRGTTIHARVPLSMAAARVG